MGMRTGGYGDASNEDEAQIRLMSEEQTIKCSKSDEYFARTFEQITDTPRSLTTSIRKLIAIRTQAKTLLVPLLVSGL